MNIHFIFPLAKPEWPILTMLKQHFPNATIDCSGQKSVGRYRNKLQLFTKLPWLIYFVFCSVLKRYRQEKACEYVCVNSDIEVIGCLLAQLFTKTKIKIILFGFIYTTRPSKILTKLRWFYFKLILSKTYGVICYSQVESELLPKLFELKNVKFSAIKYGCNFSVSDNIFVKEKDHKPYIVSAGRSGRDYALLCDAVKNLPINLHIICDSEHALQGLVPPPNVTILRNCYGKDYIKALACADLVVLALKDQKISSGQMVLVDAMALGKATVITQTPTTIEYGEHLKTCYFVQPNSVDEIRHAINTCLMPDIANEIGKTARQFFLEQHALAPFTASLAAKIKEMDSEK